MDTQDAAIKIPGDVSTKNNTTPAPVPGPQRFCVLSFMKTHTRIQPHALAIYQKLRYILFLGYGASAIFKLPALYDMITLAYQLYSNKKDQPSDGTQKDNQSFTLIFNVLFLYVSFIALIITQFSLSYNIFRRNFNGLLCYLAWFLFYLLFVATAYFVDLHNSTMILGLALFLVQYNLFGIWDISGPIEVTYVILKISIAADVLLFLGSILIYVLITKYKTHTLQSKTFKSRNYNLA